MKLKIFLLSTAFAVFGFCTKLKAQSMDDMYVAYAFTMGANYGYADGYNGLDYGHSEPNFSAFPPSVQDQCEYAFWYAYSWNYDSGVNDSVSGNPPRGGGRPNRPLPYEPFPY